ncbi:MAG: SDR family NAD(P)-dependent oxidoreductase, partial [Pseudomonadales bacterium]|nr:SDR family NAD(P)-dependent oxidoreductase [Pseudomonadales bacterium]
MAVVAKNKEQLINKLKQVAQGIDVVGAYRTNRDNPKATSSAKNIGWLFTGQGSQHADMGKALYDTDPDFKILMDRCDQLLNEEIGVSLLSLLWGELKDNIDQTQYTQPAIFCLEYCLAQFWFRVGIKPTIMIGHSVGEYAAAVIAGLFSLEDAIKLIAARGRLMLELTEQGSMAAILTDEESLIGLLKEFKYVDKDEDQVIDIAVYNSPNNIVVSGTHDTIAKFSAFAEEKGIETKALTVSHAFHSQMMTPMLAEFKKVAASVQYEPAKIELISTLTGELNKGEMSRADYWVDHVKSAVQFSQSVQKLGDFNLRVVMEIGPGSTLLGLAKQSLKSSVTYIQSQRPKQDGSRQISLALAELYSNGINIDWKGFDQPYHRLRIAVPSYCFDRKTYWLGDIRNGGAAASTSSTTIGKSGGQYLGMISSPMSDDVYFENTFTEASPFNLDDHRLYEAVVAPGAFHLAMVLLSAQKVLGDKPVVLDDVVFPEPLVFDDNMKRRLHYGFKKLTESNSSENSNDNTYEVKGFSREESSDTWIMHTSMTARAYQSTQAGLSLSQSKLSSQDLEAIQSAATTVVEGTEFYQGMWDAGYQLGSQFQWIDKVWRKPGEALTQLRLPHPEEISEFLIQPGLMDSCFQSSAMATMHENMEISELDAIYIPFAVENLVFLRKPTSTLWCHVKVTEAQAADAESYSHSIKVYDDQGDIIIDIGTLYSKRAPKDLLLKALKKEPLDDHYETHWLEQDKKEALALEASGKWLVIDDIINSEESNAALIQQLIAAINTAGGDPLLIKQGDAYSSSSGSKQAAITLQFADVGQWTQLLNDLGGNAAIKGVLFSSLFETDLNALHHGQQILDSQHQLFAGKLNCIKALQLQASTQNPRLWFISKGMMNVGVGNETMGPLSSGVSGFAKVMQMEHPELNSVFIDIESITNDAMLQHTSQSIINEMAEAGTEKMVALRLGKRHVPRLSRLGNAASKMEIPAAPYRLIIEKKGVFDDLKYVQFEPVPLTATEVAVKVLRSGLNFRDVMGVLDVYPGEAGPLGGECIGEIIQLGSDVKDLSIGDRILIPLGMACMSSQMNTESQLVTRIPRNLTLNEAATIPVAYTTAMHGLVNLGKLKKGDRILIHAGAGGVGLAAIYIAKKLGAEIFATASEKKRPFLRSIGVDHVLDSRSLSFADDIKRITNNDGVDVVLNSLAGEFIRASMGLLNKGGRFIEIGKADIWSPERVTAFRDDITYDSFDLVTLTFTDPHLVKKLMDGIVNDLEQGALKPLPYKEFRQSEAIDAFRYMAQGKHIGKILINPEPEPLTIRTDSSYLITGAGGGLGLLFADWLISKGAKELVLVGRKDIRETQTEAIIALEEKGATVHCLPANMGDEKSVNTLFQTIDETCLPL